MTSTSEKNLQDIAQATVEIARAKGANDAAGVVNRSRDVEVSWRDGKLEKISEASTQSLQVQLYVDGRYATASTSDLRPEAISRMIENSISIARALALDPARSLPHPSLYEGRESIDLELSDPSITALTSTERRGRAAALEAAVRSVKGANKFNSVSTSWSDTSSETVRVHSNGFAGQRQETFFAAYADASITDVDGRRPSGSFLSLVRFQGELPSIDEIGRMAAEKTLSRLGTQKGASASLPMIVENRVAGSLVRHLLAPLTAASLQQKRSLFEGKLGQPIGSKWLDFTDDPFVKRGLGSRHFDAEGITARRHVIFSQGQLQNFYIDNYYGKKLQEKPTTASPSNLSWKLGTKNLDALMAEIADGVLVTGFLGGNSNSTTGDFSLGIEGFRIRKGRPAEPVAEMNLSGNHLEFWKRLVKVGNDPYASSSLRTPTLVFDRAQFAGV